MWTAGEIRCRWTPGNRACKGYADKAGATKERIIADRRYACADGYAGKAGALEERSVANRRATGDGYGSNTW